MQIDLNFQDERICRIEFQNIKFHLPFHTNREKFATPEKKKNAPFMFQVLSRGKLSNGKCVPYFSRHSKEFLQNSRFTRLSNILITALRTGKKQRLTQQATIAK